MLTRRVFLRGSAIAMAGFGSAPRWLARAASTGQGKRKILVAIFQRGACDGLNVVAPFGEKRYYELRPSIAIAAPTTGAIWMGGSAGGGAAAGRAVPFNGNGANAIDLDGHFGLHPALQPLKELWDKQQLAIVEAVGSPDPSRSHFDAQDYMESGTPGKPSSDGWLNRALPPAGPDGSPLRAVAVGSELPRTLRGERPAIALNNAAQFQTGNQEATTIIEDMYATTPDARLGRTGRDAFAAMKTIQAINREPYRPSNNAQYGLAGELGRGLQQIARLIKADAGVEAAFAEIGGWDHHSNENPQLSNLLRQFGWGLAAFYADMGDRMEDIVVVTMSEFGRTAQENGNGGTDHGHGDVMMALGGPVRGGKVYGAWPGLEKEQLYEGRDLAVTTDFRTVLGELVRGHLGQKNLAQAFPGFEMGEGLGLLKT
ncbi:MAG TPA: DUF1501 domain-containing protein [Bryobacteraceae bacterium]|nr:DUF1501 domain-containing protein [Bryobacteraceae bacterium]